jgi:hypothetical protein
LATTINPTDKAPDGGKADDTKKEELHQQWRSANAAEESACISRWQLWLSALGIGGLVGTIMYAARNAKAAADAADQVRRQNELSIRLEKAFLQIDDVIISYIQPNTVSVPITNRGKTFAILIEATVDIAVGTEQLVGPPTYSRAITRDHEFLPEGGKSRILGHVAREGLLPVMQGDERAVIWGYVRYEDLFGRKWRRGFGLRVAFTLTVEGDETVVWERSGGDAYNYDQPEV